MSKFHSYEAVSSDILLLIDGILKDKNYLNHHTNNNQMNILLTGVMDFWKFMARLLVKKNHNIWNH